nr:hypothetical protein [Tanacetum cinerariifolium]
MIKFCRQANGCPSARVTAYSILHKDILIDSLDITPTNDDNPYVAPPLSDTVIEYVNTLGYPITLINVSKMSVNALYQPWRAILSMINMCLTEFVQSIQTFLTDRKNLTTASRRKKKITHLFILSVRFTKLIIHHLKTKHNIHPRTGSPLRYSHDENVMNTLGFVGKDDREIFSMPIPNAFLTDEIKGAPYYSKYQEHVAKYQQYLVAEHGKVEEGGATKSLKATKVTKPKAAKATKPGGDKAPNLTSTQPSKPKPAPTQPSKAVPEKKQKLVKETPNEPSPAKRSNGGLVGKIHKPRSPLKLVDKPSTEDVLGPAHPVVIREPDSGRIQPLPDVQEKGKEKVVDEQVAHDLLTLLTSKNKIHAGPDPGDHDEGQVRPNPGVQDEGQARSNPDPVILKEPTSSTGTMSSLQNFEKELSFTNQFFMEKQREEEPGKTNTEAEVQLMVSVPIHQDTSSVPPMTTSVSKAVDEIVTDAVDWAMKAPLRAHFSDLPIVDIKEIIQQWIFEDKSYEAHKDHKKLYDTLEKSLERDYSYQLLSDLEEARQKKRKRRDLPITPFGSPPPQPPPPPPLAGASGAPGTSGASGSSQSPLPPLPPSTGTSGSAQQQGSEALSLSKSDDSILDEHVYLSNDEDLGMITYQKLIQENTGGNHYLERKDQRLLNLLGPFLLPIKGSSLALSISKMKATSYPEFGLELLVPEQISILIDMILHRVKKKSDHTCGFSVSSELKPTQDTGMTRGEHRSKTGPDRPKPDRTETDLVQNARPRTGPKWYGLVRVMLSTVFKLWTQNLVIRQRVKDFQLVVFSVNNNKRRIMRFNEIYKFSDGTLTQILEALAYRVKEFKIKRLNQGMNTRFWTQKDVIRSKEFITAIERRLKMRRIY